MLQENPYWSLCYVFFAFFPSHDVCPNCQPTGTAWRNFEQTEHCVHDALRRFQGEQWQAIYTAGCGDSFYAGLACEMAFARFCRLPVKALPAMHFARYEVDNALTPAVLFGISNSGAVSRTIEAVAMA